ncbi:Lrp/AsnC family transcriptional regulator [Pedobacter heparinus]|uniref:Lrp/AsnC family transcriptional regulator n=1 Tax=Pedobacter heparinus TaxID=984 RepID=UPI00292D206B|nr:Lrp/AsnC family transcriptional regulator [Pedobacter heparinus]
MYLNLDAIDAKILFYLQKNAKMPIKEMSEYIHLSESAIHARIRNLEERGCIKNYVAVLNKSMVNKKLTSFTGLQLRTHTQYNLITSMELISKFPEVINCYMVNGDFDFLLHVAVADMQEYHSFFSNALLKVKNIETVKTFFVLDESKADNRIDLSRRSRMRH